MARRYEMQSRTNVHFLVFHLTLADAIVSFITMPMETIWRVVIEVHIHRQNNCEECGHQKFRNYCSGNVKNVEIKSKEKIAVVRGELCMQGADDGSHWWLHPLLSHAYCSFHRQVIFILLSINRWSR